MLTNRQVKIFIFFFLIFLFSSQAFSQSSEKYIKSINLDGNDNLSLSDILFLVRQRPSDFFFKRSKFNPRLLKLDALTLKSYYHSKGFLDVTVDGLYSSFSDQVFVSSKMSEPSVPIIENLCSL